MRRFVWSILLLFATLALVLAACTSFEPENQPTDTTTLESPSTATIQPTATTAEETAAPKQTVQQSEIEETEEATTIPATSSPTPGETLEAETTTAGTILNDLSLETDDITIYPVPVVYAGDRVSFQVSPAIPRGLAPNDVNVRVLVDGNEVVTGDLSWRKLSGDTVGLYQWVWDTINQDGPHTITAVLDPQDRIQIGDENPNNNEASIEITVESRDKLPDSEADATWVSTSIDCCNVHVVSGTAAHRDLDTLLPEVDAAFEKASEILDERLQGPYEVYLIDRVIGQGGYAIESMVISYLDRNYAGGGLHEVLVHESVHLIDQQFAPDRITFLSEGVAVWTAGGHYRQEDLGQRMAALVEMDRVVPLAHVIDNFYATQHEISYLEAASLVTYLVETYGWAAVRSFYMNVSADDGPTLSQAVDTNLRIYFNRNLAQLEEDWLEYISGFPRDRTTVTDLKATVQLYDIIRRYQTIYDPTAYYLYAWLPSPEVAMELDATADFSRHPDSITNIALETMLQAANDALEDGEYEKVNALIVSVGRVINNDGQFLDPLAKSYLDISRAASEEGFEVQQVTIDNRQAEVVVKVPGKAPLRELKFRLNQGREWVLSQ